LLKITRTSIANITIKRSGMKAVSLCHIAQNQVLTLWIYHSL